MFPPLAKIPEGASHLLTLLILCPSLGALTLFLVPSKSEALARSVAVLFGLLTFALSVLVAWTFPVGSAEFQLLERTPWINDFGINYIVGVDGLSLSMVLLTTFLSVLVLISSGSISSKVRAYLGCLLFLETGMLGTFLALDGFTFYIFWELMLIPMYFLIGVWGGSRKIYAALKFVIYTALGSLLMLVAIVTLSYLHFKQFGSYSFYLGDWTHLSIDSVRLELLLFAAFSLAFAIKVPMFPLHTWLPDAHVEAPTGGSVILAGVLLKMGLYGMIRFCVPIFPAAVVATAPLFAFLGVVGIVYGALVAWVQTDMKKLVAYSSVSHLGFCVLGYAALNLTGMQGAVLQMINHGISTAALFFLVGVLYDRTHTRRIADYGGVAAKVPLFAVVFLVFTLSSIGLPLTNGFIGEFLILRGGFEFSPVLGGFAVSGVVLGAVYMLSLYRRVVFGPVPASKGHDDHAHDLKDLTLREKVVFLPLLVAVFILGLYPQPILRLIEPSSKASLAVLNNERMTQISAGGVAAVGAVKSDQQDTGETEALAGGVRYGRL